MPLGDVESGVHQRQEECFCNQVAAELLVPTEELLIAWKTNTSLADNCYGLRKSYKVSPVVLARRGLDAGLVSREDYQEFYRSELNKYKGKKGGGGSFNLKARNGMLFASAVVGAALEGKLLLRDASRLLNISKASTLNELAKSLNIG